MKLGKSQSVDAMSTRIAHNTSGRISPLVKEVMKCNLPRLVHGTQKIRMCKIRFDVIAKYCTVFYP